MILIEKYEIDVIMIFYTSRLFTSRIIANMNGNNKRTNIYNWLALILSGLPIVISVGATVFYLVILGLI